MTRQVHEAAYNNRASILVVRAYWKRLLAAKDRIHCHADAKSLHDLIHDAVNDTAVMEMGFILT